MREESKFIRVACSNCKNEQVIFGKASTEIKCSVCKKVLAKPTGGKTEVKAKIIEVL